VALAAGVALFKAVVGWPKKRVLAEFRRVLRHPQIDIVTAISATPTG
jgi:hypothetical protein